MMTPPRTLTTSWLIREGACLEAVDWFKARTCREAHDVLTALIQEGKLDWANWLIVRVMTRHHYLAYAVYAADQVIGLYEKRYPNDSRPRHAIEAAKACLKHDTKKNREAAKEAAEVASDAVTKAANEAALEVERSASWDAGSACESAGAAWEAARSASWAAGGAFESAKAAMASSEAAGAVSWAARAVLAARVAGTVWEAAKAAGEAAEVNRAAMQKNILAEGMRLLKEGP